MKVYIRNQLKAIGKGAKIPECYHHFRLSNEVMSRVIALGLKGQPRERRYGRPKAGPKLFKKIHIIVTSLRSVKTIEPHSASSYLVPITRSSHQYKNLTLSHITAMSIHNKITQFQLHLIQRMWTYVL